MVAGRSALGSISRNNDLLTAQEWVEHTHVVLHEIDEAEDSLQDAREAALHYILTPEKEDLDNFDAAVMKTWLRVARISDMTADEKGYPERIEQLRGFIEKELLQLRDNLRTTKTLLIFHSPATDANHDRVRAAIQKLKDDEKELLRVRSEAVRTRAREVARSGFLVVGGFSVLAAVLIVLLILESRKLFAGQNASGAQTGLQGPLQQLQPGRAAAAAAGDEKSNG
ncbi:MAG TPA: CHASE3 domain-containing protein [Alphaproteobacteria bacterium]|nr:CHASE3 domain-containing protein [Alphaproteobacteria bacterium]